MLFRSLLVAALAAAVSASNVIDLTPDNFDDVVGKGKPALVELYVLFANIIIDTNDFLALHHGGTCQLLGKQQ